MRAKIRIWFGTLGLALLAWAPEAAAQSFSFLRFSGKKEVRVNDVWSERKGSKERIASVTLTLPGLEKPVELYRGKPVRAEVAARDGSVLVAMFHGGASPLVRLSLVDLSGAEPKAREIRVARPADAERRPASIVASADPEGYSVIWQEESTRDPNADVRTYLTRVSKSGRLLQKPTLVAIPWALAALVHDGKGYHLALYYDAAGPGQTRLAMVTLNAKGEPQEHPWWASAAGDIADVELVVAGGRVRAFYRGGARGEELDSSDVSSVGQWGQEPAAPESHGKIGSDEVYGVRVTGSKTKIERRTASSLL